MLRRTAAAIAVSANAAINQPAYGVEALTAAATGLKEDETLSAIRAADAAIAKQAPAVRTS
ncbi:hypothetical protein AB6A23_16760 [Paenibacillus tarimensis]